MLHGRSSAEETQRRDIRELVRTLSRGGGPAGGCLGPPGGPHRRPGAPGDESRERDGAGLLRAANAAADVRSGWGPGQRRWLNAVDGVDLVSTGAPRVAV